MARKGSARQPRRLPRPTRGRTPAYRLKTVSSLISLTQTLTSRGSPGTMPSLTAGISSGQGSSPETLRKLSGKALPCQTMRSRRPRSSSTGTISITAATQTMRETPRQGSASSPGKAGSPRRAVTNTSERPGNTLISSLTPQARRTRLTGRTSM